MNSETMQAPETFDVVELDETMLDLVVGGAAAPADVNYKCNSSCNTVAGCGGTKTPTVE